jgi:hypothetical protein
MVTKSGLMEVDREYVKHGVGRESARSSEVIEEAKAWVNEQERVKRRDI